MGIDSHNSKFQCMWYSFLEAATDPNEPKRKNFKKSKDLSFHESDDGTKENPYDFYKFAEQTAESIKDNGTRPHGIANSFSQPPRWLNRRPKITYSKMCKQAIQVSSFKLDDEILSLRNFMIP